MNAIWMRDDSQSNRANRPATLTIVLPWRQSAAIFLPDARTCYTATPPAPPDVYPYVVPSVFPLEAWYLPPTTPHLYTRRTGSFWRFEIVRLGRENGTLAGA